MSCIRAKDIMHPRVSLPSKMKGEELVEKLMCSYPALPVVNDKLEVVGVVSEYDVISAVKEGRTIHEFSAESIMTCGHAEHEGVCAKPVTVVSDAPIEEIVNLFYENSSTLSILPVVEKKKLVGIISRKNIVNALAEKGFWKEHEFKKRV
ncbi:MAG: CBS domain-containing protein [Nitrospirae bacterium]|nr:CBS domain-containing protein [Nitrospirota bacterium]